MCSSVPFLRKFDLRISEWQVGLRNSKWQLGLRISKWQLGLRISKWRVEVPQEPPQEDSQEASARPDILGGQIHLFLRRRNEWV